MNRIKICEKICLDLLRLYFRFYPENPVHPVFGFLRVLSVSVVKLIKNKNLSSYEDERLVLPRYHLVSLPGAALFPDQHPVAALSGGPVPVYSPFNDLRSSCAVGARCAPATRISSAVRPNDFGLGSRGRLSTGGTPSLFANHRPTTLGSVYEINQIIQPYCQFLPLRGKNWQCFSRSYFFQFSGRSERTVRPVVQISESCITFNSASSFSL
jgi:hypothetical protein